MEPKKTKYDTNPLDPDYVRQTEEVWGEDDGGPGTREVKGATREVGSSSGESARSNIYSEAPTRTFDTPPSGFGLSFSICPANLFPAGALSSHSLSATAD